MSTLNVSNITDGTTTVGTSYVVNGSAKAWVNFNGTNTASVRSSLNVSSLTDNGTGDFTINFSSSLTDSNYASNFGGNQDLSNYNKYVVGPYSSAPSSSAFRIRSQDSGGSARDFQYTFVSFFR